jgi:hypothetical protein
MERSIKAARTQGQGRIIMIRRNTLRLGLAALIGFTFASGQALAQQKTLKDQLAGAWTVVSNEITAPDGKKRQDYGPKPYGILVLDAGGHYAFVAGRPDRAKFQTSGNSRLGTPAAELGEAARAFAANFGTWSVNEAEKILTRKYEGALIPNNDGNVTNASISLSGDDLKLSATSASGERTDAVYRRAK